MPSLLLRDADEAVRADPDALPDRVGAGGAAAAEEPGPDPGVQAARHRVLVDSETRHERTDLVVGRAAGRMPPDDAGRHAHPLEVRAGRPSTASASCSTTTTQPGPLSTHSAATTSHAPIPRPSAIVAISSSVAGPERISGGAVNAQPSSARRRGTRPTAALLHEPIGRRTRVLRPGVRRAERRMPRERQLRGRREDPEPVVGARHGRRQHERRLGEVRPARERLHRVRRRAPPRRGRPRRGCRRAPTRGRRRPDGTAARSWDERAEALLHRLGTVGVDLGPRRAHLGEAGERVTRRDRGPRRRGSAAAARRCARRGSCS